MEQIQLFFISRFTSKSRVLYQVETAPRGIGKRFATKLTAPLHGFADAPEFQERTNFSTEGKIRGWT
jgi:hypothetical protein